MSVLVLKNRAQIEKARSEMLRRGLDILDTSHQQEFAANGHIVPIGDWVKSWDVLKTIIFLEQNVDRAMPILDIGAFCSEVPCDLHLLNFTNLFGVDLNPGILRMPYCNTINYSIANFMHTPFPDESFSAVTAISVIEHGFDGEQLLAELARILMPRGYFIASVDYWKEKISTEGLDAFGMDWKIFSKEELLAFFDAAARYGLYPVGSADFETDEKTVSWNNRDYTFAWFVLQKIELPVHKASSIHNFKAANAKDTVAFLSTFNQQCGIATHTQFVLDGIRTVASKADQTRPKILVFAEDVQPAIPDEAWIVRSWKRHGENFERLKRLLLHNGVTKLHIQFQIALFVGTDILGLARFCRDAGIQCYITFHSSENGLPLCASLVNLSTKSFVHLEQSAIRIVAFGADASKIILVPHGIHNDRPRVPKEVARAKLGLDQKIKLISSFGFCEQHKGVFEIIAELPDVFERHPEAAFIFLGGSHRDNPMSVEYVSQCKQFAAQLNIKERVIFADSFLSEEMVSAYLYASDLMIMNYLPIRNEISGAAAFTLSHRRPLIASATPAFHHLVDCTLQISLDMTVSAAINLVLESHTLHAYLIAQTEKYIENASYEVLGQTLLIAYGMADKAEWATT